MNSFPTIFHGTHHRHNTANHRPIDNNANIIICGRGKGLDNLPGNIRFRKILRKYAASYKAPGNNRKDKSLLLRSIRDQMIYHENMQFYKRDEHDVLKPLSGVEIKHKISHALRDINRSPSIDVSNTGLYAKAKKSKDTLKECLSRETKMNIEKEGDINEAFACFNEPLPFDFPKERPCDQACCHVVTSVLEHYPPDNTLLVKGWESEPKLNTPKSEAPDNEKVCIEEERTSNHYIDGDHIDPLMTPVNDIWSDINSRSAPF